MTVELGLARHSARATEAVNRIVAITNDEPSLRRRAVALLESAADLLSERRPIVDLPADEQAAWERLGARFDDSSVDRSLLATRLAFTELVEASLAGDTAVAEYLGVDRTRVSHRLTDRSLYAFVAGDTRHFPTWQFHSGRTVNGLKDVVSALDATLHPLVVTRWFTTPSLELEMDDTPVSPLEWLITGGPPDVVAALASHL